uniref:Calponin-homology (CH) domain-containing protein n=1 Tax=Schistocephalus solidus TaxID=70667 RepID=A0A183TE69_SCHSO
LLQALDEERVTNGTALADLLNVLSGSQLILKVPCLSRDDRIENITLLLKRLRELRVPVQSIREEDVVDGEKNTIARLLLSMSASFMPSRVHDVKHEIQDRDPRNLPANKTHNHATNATPSCWRMGDHACSASTEQQQRPPERRYIQRPVFRFQPVALHRLVAAGTTRNPPRSGSLGGGGVNGLHCNHKTLLLSNSSNGSNAPLGLLLKPSPSLNSFTYRQSSSATSALISGGCGGSSDIHLFSPTGESVCSAAIPGCGGGGGGLLPVDRRSQEGYLRCGRTKAESPMRAAKSLSALPSLPRRYVSRLFIPNLRQETAITEDCTKKNGPQTSETVTQTEHNPSTERKMDLSICRREALLDGPASTIRP